MASIRWEGIPEKYWPNTETPWRCSWGFGCFQDFPSREQAEDFCCTIEPSLGPHVFDATVIRPVES